ncbi:hypothetical protein [Rhabdothermincola salaria]|uniref:hypothetical protein n=1 Tax=Rhabdothermincola salaria TaxID=2903142 RepID=UPI001E49E744|nr:hypothetical protein [Rhabdothermincola salaria]MCD9623892.1 hypothetical protein [Rhabdothermincola salaria]
MAEPPTTAHPGPTPVSAAAPPAGCARSPLGTFIDCPHCGGDMAPEHAHFRCTGCGWRDSCCD